MEWIATVVAVLAAGAAFWQALEARKARRESQESSQEAGRQAEASMRAAKALEDANTLRLEMARTSDLAEAARNRRVFAADVRALIDDDGMRAILGLDESTTIEAMRRDLVRTSRAAEDSSYVTLLGWVESTLVDLRDAASAEKSKFEDFAKYDRLHSLGRRVSEWAEAPTSMPVIIESEARRAALVRALNSVTSAKVTPLE